MSVATVRRFWLVIHRWAGLYMAGFLVVAGLTGAVLAFDAQINNWLNPEPQAMPMMGTRQLDGFTLREKALKIEPRAFINFVPLNFRPAEPYYFYLEPKSDPATGKPFNLDCTGLTLDPCTGAVLSRETDERLWPVTRRNLTSVIFALHTSLACGDYGRWAFGIAAMIWSIDCFVGLFLTLPVGSAGPQRNWLARWMRSWQFTWRGRTYRVQFNLHRALGLWVWPLLFLFAISSVHFNLPEIYNPAMHRLFKAPALPGDLPDLPTPRPEPALSWREAAAIGERLTNQVCAEHDLERRNSAGAMWFTYYPEKGVFSYPAHGATDIGEHYPATTVYFDGETGALKAVDFASHGNMAKAITTFADALHNGTLGGLWEHLLIFFTGISIAALSGGGVYIWWKRRRLNDSKFQNQLTPT